MHRALVIEPMGEDVDREPGRTGASGGRPGVPGSLVQVAIGLFGFLALVGGGAATFVLQSETGAVAALVGGFALLIAAAVLPRLTEVGVSTEGMTLKLTADAAAAGAPKAASLLESSGLADYAAAYGIVNAELREKEEFRAARVHLQDSVVRRARAFAFANKIPAAEVRALFLHGSPVLRTLAIGMMQGDPSTTDAALLASAISSPLSANEQYQALVLARTSGTGGRVRTANCSSTAPARPTSRREATEPPRPRWSSPSPDRAPPRGRRRGSDRVGDGEGRAHEVDPVRDPDLGEHIRTAGRRGELLEEPLQAGRGGDHQQATAGVADVLEGVRDVARAERHAARRRVEDRVARFEAELALQDPPQLVLAQVGVERGPLFGAIAISCTLIEPLVLRVWALIVTTSPVGVSRDSPSPACTANGGTWADILRW